MNYKYKQYESRKYLRRNIETLEESVVSVSNRNNFSVERHMELLNLNDDKYEYIKYLGSEWFYKYRFESKLMDSFYVILVNKEA